MNDSEDSRTPESTKHEKICESTSAEEEDKSRDVATTVTASDQSNPAGSSVVPVIAGHYNALEDKGLEARTKCRIFYMRNFNNWIKSVIIVKYLTQIRDKKMHGQSLKVLDLGCGKGGDLIKWKVGRISHLLCADVAEASIEQCEERYTDMTSRSDGRRGSSSIYTAEFIHADCTKERLRSKYKDPSIKLDLVSCQFAFHYCFESLPQADMMVCNAAESLSIGGYFIGTMPDANEIVKRLKMAEGNEFGNSVYKVTFECPTSPPSSIPLFGAKYNFYLEDVVSCPEFLVHFPTFVRLAERHGLKLVSKQSFSEIFQENCKSSGFLLKKMQALENYPPISGYELLGDAGTSYSHAKSFLSQQKTDMIGTLSIEEWEVTSVYMAFAFQKVR